MVKLNKEVDIKYQRIVHRCNDLGLAILKTDNVPLTLLYTHNYNSGRTCWIYEVSI